MFDGTLMSSILNVLRYMCFHKIQGRVIVAVQESGSCREESRKSVTFLKET